MKNLIIIIGTVLLGLAICNMMVGSQQGSLKNAVKEVMLHSIAIYTEQDGGVE